jgi:hypothetical protein
MLEKRWKQTRAAGISADSKLQKRMAFRCFGVLPRAPCFRRLHLSHRFSMGRSMKRAKPGSDLKHIYVKSLAIAQKASLKDKFYA